MHVGADEAACSFLALLCSSKNTTRTAPPRTYTPGATHTTLQVLCHGRQQASLCTAGLKCSGARRVGRASEAPRAAERHSQHTRGEGPARRPARAELRTRCFIVLPVRGYNANTPHSCLIRRYHFCRGRRASQVSDRRRETEQRKGCKGGGRDWIAAQTCCSRRPVAGHGVER